MKATDPINPFLETTFNERLGMVRETNHKGIDLRTHLAAMAMQGMCTKYSTLGNGFTYDQRQDIALEAVLIADALIEKLNENK